MQTAEAPVEARLHDPLSTVAREERKSLLGLSAIGLVIARSGLVPSEISALGIQFDHTDQGALLGMLAAIIIYFWVAFVVYRMSDLFAFRLAVFQAEQAAKNGDIRETSFVYGPFRFATGVRAFFEFAVPLVVGGLAIGALLSVESPKNGSERSSEVSAQDAGSPAMAKAKCQ